jgi:hypothetical protein
MKNEPMIDPNHRKIQGMLRTFGPLLLVAGLVLLAIGLISFFSAFGTGEFPRYFWCAMVGLPLVGVGLSLSKFGYLGEVLRYMSGEVAPVGKDTFNYMAEGTRPGVETIARAVGEGIRAGTREESKPCVRCQARNDFSARFCNQCGAPLEELVCDTCHHPNAADARFCGQCGRPLG